MRRSGRKRYSWSTPNRYPVEAQTLGRWLESLPDRRPETFVEAARDPASVGHTLFEWNESMAAQQFRLTQARVIYGSLVVEAVITLRNTPETMLVKAVHRTSRSGEYDSFEDAFSVPDKRNFILAQALAQLSAFKRRYKALNELALVFAAADEVEAQHVAARVPRRRRSAK